MITEPCTYINNTLQDSNTEITRLTEVYNSQIARDEEPTQRISVLDVQAMTESSLTPRVTFQGTTIEEAGMVRPKKKEEDNKKSHSMPMMGKSQGKN